MTSDKGLDSALSGLASTALVVPTEKAKAVIIFVHGFRDHASRYLGNFFTLLYDHGYSVLAWDLPGHGKSSGRTTDIGMHLCSVRLMIDLATARSRCTDALGQKGLPIFLVGYSIGALLFLRHLELCDSKLAPRIDGIICISPPLDLSSNVPWLINALAPLIAKLAPNYEATHYHPELYSSDPGTLEELAQDELFYKAPLAAAAAYAIKRLSDHTREELGRIDLPLLALSGEEDEITPVNCGKLLYDGVATAPKRKNMMIYPHARHDLLHEHPVIRNAVLRDILGWLDRQINELSTDQSDHL